MLPRTESDSRDADEIRRAADRICALILYSDLPRVDIDLAGGELRRLCRRRFPERPYLFDWIYAPRFRRLWEQWRVDRPPGSPQI